MCYCEPWKWLDSAGVKLACVIVNPGSGWILLTYDLTSYNWWHCIL